MRAVLEDAFAILEVDTSVAYDEERLIITGIVNGRILRAVYTERSERIRIISAAAPTLLSWPHGAWAAGPRPTHLR